MPAHQTAPTESILVEIEGVMATTSHSQRIEMLRRVTDLFVAAEPTLSPEQSVLFDQVFHRLVENIEAVARAELSRRIAPFAHAPHGLVRGLALDPDIEIAGPILLQSPVLDESDLLAVARVHGQSHLQAIASRRDLSEAVTDVLVERGDRDVVRTVAANDTARLSRAAFRRLIARVRGDDELQEVVGTRADLPEELFPALIAQATEAVARRLTAARADIDAGRARTAALRAGDIVTAQMLNDPELTSALDEMTQLRDIGKLNERVLRDYARRGQPRHVLVGLSLICDLGVAATQRLMTLDNTEPLLVVAKSANLSWITVRELLRFEGPSADKKLAAAFESYTKLTRETAKRIVRFWHVRDAAQRTA